MSILLSNQYIYILYTHHKRMGKIQKFKPPNINLFSFKFYHFTYFSNVMADSEIN